MRPSGPRTVSPNDSEANDSQLHIISFRLTFQMACEVPISRIIFIFWPGSIDTATGGPQHRRAHYARGQSSCRSDDIETFTQTVRRAA